ncbi:MAG: hypothetical protein ACLP9C_14385 [Acidimicrobiales bacterium]
MNGALMTSAWFFLPASLKDKLFTFHGTLAFAVVLAFWMYSDVPATNVLGPDRLRVIAAIDDPVIQRRLLYAKNIVLWILVTPICVVVAFAIGLYERDLLATLYTIVWLGLVPLGVLGLSNLVGIRFPYHPMPLRFRWEHRVPRRRMLVRWLALVVTPYGLVPALGVLLMLPSLALWGFTAKGGLSKRLPSNDLGWGIALACGIAGLAWWGGHRVGTWLLRRRRAQVLDFLGDPGRG